jgi:hypothetical protein
MRQGWEHPNFDAPALPDPPEVATAPCSLGGGDVLDSQAAHASDLAALEALGEPFGVPSYEAKLGDIFTLPDTMQQAVLSTRYDSRAPLGCPRWRHDC